MPQAKRLEKGARQMPQAKRPTNGARQMSPAKRLEKGARQGKIELQQGDVYKRQGQNYLMKSSKK